MANNSMGQFMAALRKANGMTQQDVADRLNVSNKAVSRWERDESAPDISLIPAIAEMYGVSCDELLKGARSRDAETQEKKEIKVDKQLKSLINRTLSGFKTQIYIALALALVGLICMFGISYGFYRPVVGFAVMLMLEAAALVVAIVAVSKTKDIKNDNEMFEMADDATIERFDKSFGSFSFWAFYTVLAVVLLSLPLVIVRSDYYINAVIPPDTYFAVFFGLIVLALAVIYLKCEDVFVEWLTKGTVTVKKKPCRRMDLMQIGLAVLAGVAFVCTPYFYKNDDSTPVGVVFTVCLGFLCMAASLAVFAISLKKAKENKRSFVLSGIRNLLLLPADFIVVNMHTVGWGAGAGEEMKRFELWHMEYLLYAIIYCTVVFLVFAIIGFCIKKREQ